MAPNVPTTRAVGSASRYLYAKSRAVIGIRDFATATESTDGTYLFCPKTGMLDVSSGKKGRVIRRMGGQRWIVGMSRRERKRTPRELGRGHALLGEDPSGFYKKHVEDRDDHGLGAGNSML